MSLNGDSSHSFCLRRIICWNSSRGISLDSFSSPFIQENVLSHLAAKALLKLFGSWKGTTYTCKRFRYCKGEKRLDFLPREHDKKTVILWFSGWFFFAAWLSPPAYILTSGLQTGSVPAAYLPGKVRVATTTFPPISPPKKKSDMRYQKLVLTARAENIDRCMTFAATAGAMGSFYKPFKKI